MNKALRDMSMESVHCTIHLLQLAVVDGVLAQQSIKLVLAKCRSLTSFLNRSSKGTALFKRKQAGLLGINVSEAKILIKDVETRWNSSYLMVRRMLDLKDAVILYTSLDEDCGVDFTTRDWELLEIFAEVLKPFFQATELLSANKIPVSSVPLIIINIKMQLTNMKARFVQTMRDTLLKNIEMRFFNPNPDHTGLPVTFNILENANYTIPLLLNPLLRKGILFGDKFLRARAALAASLMSIKQLQDQEDEIDSPIAIASSTQTTSSSTSIQASSSSSWSSTLAQWSASGFDDSKFFFRSFLQSHPGQSSFQSRSRSMVPFPFTILLFSGPSPVQSVTVPSRPMVQSVSVVVPTYTLVWVWFALLSSKDILFLWSQPIQSHPGPWSMVQSIPCPVHAWFGSCCV